MKRIIKTQKNLKGSLTIEAALVIPLFLFLLAAMLGFMSLLGIQLDSQIKLDNKVRNISRLAAGISQENSKENAEIILNEAVPFTFMFLPGNSGKIVFYNSCKSRAWVGAKIDESNTSEIVYITENGTVYHKNTGCSHLKLSIRSIMREKISECRNLQGGKYKPCEHCGAGMKSKELLYITDYGDRYHTDLGCSGLKRSIKAVKLSEVENTMGKCSRCWS